METKHILALLGFVVVGCASILATTFSQRLRDAAFFAMVCCAIFAEQFDVNFAGEYWYRGTARGIAFSITDLLAISILLATWAAPRHPARRGFVPASLGAIGIYFAYCVYMTVNALQPAFAVWELVNIPRGVLVLLAAAAYVRTRHELGILVLALACTAGIEAAIALHQRYVEGVIRARGTLEHANSLAMYTSVVGPVLLAAAMAKWATWRRVAAGLGAAAATVCVLLSISRAGLPIYGLAMIGTAVACLTWEITRPKVIGATLVLVACGAAVFATWDQFRARYAEATLAEEYLDQQKGGRGVYLRWAHAIVKDHPLGVGLNNWSYAVSKRYGATQGFTYRDYDEIKRDPQLADIPSTNYAAPAHSLAALTIGELGLPGFLLFSIVWFCWFRMGAGFLRDRLNDQPQHRLGVGIFFATSGVFLHGVTEWTFRHGTIFQLFHVLIGGLASLQWLRCRAEEPAAAGERRSEKELNGAAAVVPVAATRG